MALKIIMLLLAVNIHAATVRTTPAATPTPRATVTPEPSRKTATLARYPIGSVFESTYAWGKYPKGFRFTVGAIHWEKHMIEMRPVAGQGVDAFYLLDDMIAVTYLKRLP